MKFKQKYKIGKALSLVGLMILANACHKEPYKEMVIDWDYNNFPDRELIKQYADDKDVKTIVLNLLPYSSSGVYPRLFHTVRDSLENYYFSISPNNTIGRGNIYVDEFNGAQLPDPYATYPSGMALKDSIWYTSKGFSIVRGRAPIYKSK